MDLLEVSGCGLHAFDGGQGVERTLLNFGDGLEDEAGGQTLGTGG